jgi:hypothetical protein
MKVKDFIEMTRNDTCCVIELELPERRDGDYIVCETKSSVYDDLSDYYDWTIIGFRRMNSLAPIYRLCDAINGTDTTKYTHAYRLKVVSR